MLLKDTLSVTQIPIKSSLKIEFNKSIILKKNRINVKLGGNIGQPVLDLDLGRQPLVIIEASSFQLEHSKFICPDYALFLNLTNDHLDWHGSMKNYIKSKFKIFKL